MTQANAFTGIDRTQMPQASISDLEDLLDISEISWQRIDRDPSELRPTQSELDDEKVDRILSDMKMFDFPIHDPILISRDLMILDGHHRWAATKASGLRTISTVEIDLTWQEALAWLIQSMEEK